MDTSRFMVVEVGSRSAAMLRLFACMDGCIDDAPWQSFHDAVAESDRSERNSSAERETLVRGVEAFRAVTLERHGMRRMPEVWIIARDDPRPGVTLRNRKRWGLSTPR